MTDVTGFGLAGHLAEMLQASGGSALLDIESMPVLEGGATLFEQGFASSLQAQNLDQKHLFANLTESETHPLFPLLFDPQTAGGLLAAIPAVRTRACAAALDAAGYKAAAIIGSVVKAEAAGEGTVTIVFGAKDRAASQAPLAVSRDLRR
jgi:selenide, water dikinase